MAVPGRALATTTDPTQIQSPSQIPPASSQFAGHSSQGLVDVYSGTLAGDLDAQPAAKELLGTAPDTGSLANADYIYKQVSALFGKVDLPSFQSPSGNSVKSLVFVSGSSQGGYGAFHIEGNTQADFDRIVVDSLNMTGTYSAGSGLGAALAPAAVKLPHVFPLYRGPSDLLGIVHTGDARLKAAKPAAIREALKTAALSTLALKAAVETRNAAAIPRRLSSQPLDELAGHKHADLARRLVQANQELVGLVAAATDAIAGRQYLSTALFAAEIIESFQLLTARGNPGLTDGESVSRVVSFKLAPEIALIPGFNSAVIQQWWQDNQPDYVTDNSQNDGSTDGNGAGMMFLLFLTDYLGVPMDSILNHMPATGGAPLGDTYAALLGDYPNLAQTVGQDGASAFQKMIALLQQNAQNPDGSLNLPANGNPFPSMPGAKQGGLFADATTNSTASTGVLAQDVQTALGLESQLEQQLGALKSTLQQVQGELTGNATPNSFKARARARQEEFDRGRVAALGYKPPLAASIVANLEQQAATYRAPQYDQTLQDEIWPHVYNELPGTGTHEDRLQVITGTIQTPVAVQITGTILGATQPEPDGDLHISFQPDDSNFPTNQLKASGEPPLEVEVIYAGPVTQQDAKQAQGNYKNPFDISQLRAGTRIQVAGPLIFDRAHGVPSADGKNVDYGLEIHPVAGISVLTGPAGPGPGGPGAGVGQLSADLASAQNQAETLGQGVGSLSSLLQKMKGEVPTR